MVDVAAHGFSSRLCHIDLLAGRAIGAESIVFVEAAIAHPIVTAMAAVKMLLASFIARSKAISCPFCHSGDLPAFGENVPPHSIDQPMLLALPPTRLPIPPIPRESPRNPLSFLYVSEKGELKTGFGGIVVIVSRKRLQPRMLPHFLPSFVFIFLPHAVHFSFWKNCISPHRLFSQATSRLLLHTAQASSTKVCPPFHIQRPAAAGTKAHVALNKCTTVDAGLFITSHSPPSFRLSCAAFATKMGSRRQPRSARDAEGLCGRVQFGPALLAEFYVSGVLMSTVRASACILFSPCCPLFFLLFRFDRVQLALRRREICLNQLEPACYLAKGVELICRNCLLANLRIQFLLLLLQVVYFVLCIQQFDRRIILWHEPGQPFHQTNQ